MYSFYNKGMLNQGSNFFHGPTKTSEMITIKEDRMRQHKHSYLSNPSEYEVMEKALQKRSQKRINEDNYLKRARPLKTLGDEFDNLENLDDPQVDLAN